MTPRLKTLYDKTIIDNLMSKLNFKNKHQAPRVLVKMLQMEKK